VSAQSIEDEVAAAFDEIESPKIPILSDSAQYRDNWTGGINGVRQDHAAAVAKDPAIARAFTSGVGTFVLCAARGGGVARYSIVTLVTLGQPGLPHVETAFRVPGDDVPDPLSAFADFVTRWGVEATFGGLQAGKFVARLAVPMFDQRNTQIVEVKQPPGASQRFAASAHVQMTDGTLHLEWGYVVDVEAYKRARLG